jgi:mono/diheme cytochrome c family protein
MRSLIASIVLVCSTSVASAQCGIHNSYVPSYTPTYTPTVVHDTTTIIVASPAVFTVAVPVVSYLYGNGYSPAFAAVPAAPGFPGMIAPQAPAAQAPQSLELSDAAIDKLIDRIEKRLQQRQPVQPVQPIQQPIVQPSPPPVKTSMSVDEINTRAVVALRTSCAACHGGQTVKGGVRIFTPEGQLAANLNRSRIVNAIESGEMPKLTDPRFSVPDITDYDLAILRAWVKT